MGNLPGDILNLVFKSFTGFNIYTYEGWTKQLVLLAGYQRWRHCALPLMCRCAGFYFEDLDGYVKSKYIEDSLFTDFDRIMTIGHPSLVKSLDIYVEGNKDVFTCIKCVLNILGGHSPVWSSLHTIMIYSTTDILDVDYTAKEASAFSRKSKAIVNKIAKMMPNVVMLEFQDTSNNSVSNMFYGKLVDSYASMLKTLLAHKPVPLEDINTFSRLTYLEVDCQDNPSVILPLAHIVLKCLILRNIPESAQWYNCARNQSNKFVFSNLRKLEPEYTGPHKRFIQSTNAVDTPELHFPKLQSLTINEPSEQQLLLSCSVFKFKLDILAISATTTSLKQLSHISLPGIRQLTLDAALANHKSLNSAFDVLCNVAKVGQVIDDMRLTITDEADIDLTGCGVYPPITFLAIYNLTNYEQVFSLVQRLPLLKELILQSISTDDISNDKLKTLLRNQQGVAPISSNVDQVSFIHSGIFRTSQTAIRFIMLLLVGLPALRELYAWQIDQRVLFKIINKLKARYPHLENVRVLSP